GRDDSAESRVDRTSSSSSTSRPSIVAIHVRDETMNRVALLGLIALLAAGVALGASHLPSRGGNGGSDTTVLVGRACRSYTESRLHGPSRADLDGVVDE